MRAFIAIDLPSALKDKINEFIFKIKEKNIVNAKFVAKENLHFTLKFLGEVDEKIVNKLNSILENICLSQNSFDIELKGLGEFKKRVLWIGCENHNDFQRLANEINLKLRVLGFPKEKFFEPHLTIARIKSINDIKQFDQTIKNYKNKQFGSFKVSEVCLEQSVLTKQGPIYKKLNCFKLKCENQNY
ncbi:MAG: RNA 2',3'-cyclic phosphodiesterase [Candidatus Nanoarchaeia archaeon]